MEHYKKKAQVKKVCNMVKRRLRSGAADSETNTLILQDCIKEKIQN